MNKRGSATGSGELPEAPTEYSGGGSLRTISAVLLFSCASVRLLASQSVSQSVRLSVCLCACVPVALPFTSVCACTASLAVQIRLLLLMRFFSLLHVFETKWPDNI